MLWLWAAPGLAQEEPVSVAPRIYRWIDENGIVHYTTERQRIPSSLRNRVSQPDAPNSNPASSERWVSQDRRGRTSGDIWAEGDDDDAELDPFEAGKPNANLSAEEIAALQIERDNLDFRIAELEADISADEEAIKLIISNPDSGGPLVSGATPQFREIAERLPQRLTELRTLRTERARLETP